MELLKCLLIIAFLDIVRDIDCKCVLNLDKDFGSPSPVYLQDGGYFTPTARDVTLGVGASLTVACPGDNRYVLLGNDTSGVQVVEAHCVTDKTFRVGIWEGAFSEVKCNGQPWFTAETTQDCYGRNKLYKVGYKISNALHTLYEACFDKDQITTLYVKHELTPASKYSQNGHRPQFIEGGLFGKVRMSELYKNKNQRARLNEVLGEGKDQEYITKKQFLTRGHLAPRADFPLRAMQRASFHYVNTAPQWMRGNAGDWAALEDALRRRAVALNTNLTLYTGTYDVLMLEDSGGEGREIYLHSDENNNPAVPVPMYFFKLVYDPLRKTATAFITINSSFYTAEVNDRLSFCSDICDGNRNFSWLKWRADDTHSFCCDYDEFVKRIDFLPKLSVNGQFY